jgi:hypothetical protein
LSPNARRADRIRNSRSKSCPSCGSLAFAFAIRSVRRDRAVPRQMRFDTQTTLVGGQSRNVNADSARAGAARIATPTDDCAVEDQARRERLSLFARAFCFPLVVRRRRLSPTNGGTPPHCAQHGAVARCTARRTKRAKRLRAGCESSFI